MAKYKFYENKYFQGIVFGNEQFFKRMKKNFGNAKKVFANKKEAQKFNKGNFADLVKEYPNFMSLMSFEDNQGIFLNNLSRFEKIKSSDKDVATNINWNEDNKLNAFIAKVKSKKKEINKNSSSEKLNDDELNGIDKTSLFEDENKDLNNEVKDISDENKKQKTNIKDKIKENKDTQLDLNNQYQNRSADIVVYTDGSVRKTSTISNKNNINLSTFIINDLIDDKRIARAIEIGRDKLNNILRDRFADRRSIDLTMYSELVAIESSLEYLINKEKNCENIIIVTDSNDAIINIDKALNGNFDNISFVNDLLKDIINNMRMFNNLKFKLIKGHNKVYGNVLADGVKYFV